MVDRVVGHGGWRRTVAVIALVAGGVAAWWQFSRGTKELQVSFLLTHVEATEGSDGNDRGLLRQLDILVPRTPQSDEIGWSHALMFPATGAPQATGATKIKVASGTTVLRARCRYRLPGTTRTIQTVGRIEVDPDREDVQVVDVGTCRSAK